MCACSRWGRPHCQLICPRLSGGAPPAAERASDGVPAAALGDFADVHQPQVEAAQGPGECLPWLDPSSRPRALQFLPCPGACEEPRLLRRCPARAGRAAGRRPPQHTVGSRTVGSRRVSAFIAPAAVVCLGEQHSQYLFAPAAGNPVETRVVVEPSVIIRTRVTEWARGLACEPSQTRHVCRSNNGLWLCRAEGPDLLLEHQEQQDAVGQA